MRDYIKELAGLDDAALMKAMGLDQRLERFKKDLVEADKLSGDDRDRANEELARDMEPRVDEWTLSWVLEDIERDGNSQDSMTAVAEEY